MCKHRYIPLDLFALQDAKVEALVAEHGMAGWGIYTALLLKLAQQDEDGYTYPNNAKRLANILPKRPRAEVVRSTIEDFGLFEIATDEDGVEYLYSPRLTSHLSTLGGADKKQGEEAAPKKRSYNVSQAVKEGLGRAREAKRNRSKVEDESRKVESKVETKVESKVETKTGKSRKVETKVDESREGDSTLPSTFSSTLGGTIGGVNTPLKEKDKIEDESIPLTPTGGMERERIELEKIEDLGLRQMVSSLLYPNSDMRDYAKAFNELYATATAGLAEFAQLKTLSRSFCSDAQELFWALVPEDEQGRKVRPSVLDVLGAIEQFRAMLDEAKASSFLRSKPAMATLTWLIKVDNFAKVAAGNYRDASPSPHGTKPPVGNYSNSMWDKVKAEQAQKEETPEMRAYREKTQAMAKEVMARINQGR
jgi:hypothetical protein|uniref:Lin1244/Lin1753-like N-terminal domain-containing protein n=1 Tax=Siphoviridae sp. ctoic9 TaxID=2825671 RepID=A0A8S5Q9K7_9CAUD|nr:MAG TPA: protein of unknown function (DUF4373) [Siphoviridae sp. ctoic9]